MSGSQPTVFGMTLTAHRGDTSEHRENTMPAIAAALRLGSARVEIDVQLTVDGEVVLLHDSTLSRLWGIDKRVSELTWAQVAQLGGPGVRIPRLSEVLDLFVGSDTVVLIDMDSAGPAAAAHAVVTAHRDAAGAARVGWCGDLDAMHVIRRLDAEAEIWMPWHTAAAPSPGDFAELRPAVLNVPHLVVNAELVRAAHVAGVLVGCWTVDDLAQARHLAFLGIDAITTNRAGALAKESLETCGAQEERHRARRIAVALAEEAVRHIREHPVEDVGTKANPADHATDVDLAIERRVREVIGAQFPRHAFIGEEFGGAVEAGEPCWYLDPVDGTANLANGVPWTSFSLALVEDGAPVVAVVADPWSETIIDASAGRGAWVGERRLDLSEGRGGAAESPLRGAVVSTELAGHRPWPGMSEFIDALAEEYCTVRIMGSGTLSLAGVALGRGVGAVVDRFGPEDHLAAMLIVAEAGGVVWDDEGRETLFPAAGGILVARDLPSARALHRARLHAKGAS